MAWFAKKSIASKMGLVHDQQGIMRRYFRERQGWDKHLAHSRAYIEQASAKSRKTKAVVLGSGWLLDVPLDVLAKRFDSLYLVDMAHPVQVRHRCMQYPNVELMETDITGGCLGLVYRKWKKERQSFALPKLENLAFDSSVFDEAFFISVNLLNQLDILIYDFLEKKCTLSESGKKTFSRRLQEKHIGMLSRQEACLVSDYQTIRLDKAGNELDRQPSVYADTGMGQNRKEWLWEFDNSMRYDEKARIHFKVMAMEFNLS